MRRETPLLALAAVALPLLCCFGPLLWVAASGSTIAFITARHAPLVVLVGVTIAGVLTTGMLISKRRNGASCEPTRFPRAR